MGEMQSKVELLMKYRTEWLWHQITGQGLIPASGILQSDENCSHYG